MLMHCFLYLRHVSFSSDTGLSRNQPLKYDFSNLWPKRMKTLIKSRLENAQHMRLSSRLKFRHSTSRYSWPAQRIVQLLRGAARSPSAF